MKAQPVPIFGMSLRGILLVAGIYTLVWGAFFRWSGAALLSWMALGETVDPGATASFGLFGMVIGIMIFMSAFYPFSWIYLIGIGLVGKVASAIWFLTAFAYMVGWNKRSIFYLTANELIWLIPLAIIGYKAWQGRKYLLEKK